MLTFPITIQVPALLSVLPPSLRSAYRPLVVDLPRAVLPSYLSARSTRHARALAAPPAAFATTELFFDDYRPLSAIESWMALLTALFPELARVEHIGLSFAGRNISALQLGKPPAAAPDSGSDTALPRQTILVSGGAHAREWIATSTVTYLAHTLVTQYGRDATITRLLDAFDWVLVPTANPDGYVYSWEHDRLWRKNRQNTTLDLCAGVDLDRAWGFAWAGNESERGSGAAASDPCAETYAGDAPWDGVEAAQMADWALNRTVTGASRFVAFIDMHSYSQQILYPYAYSCTNLPPTLENLEELALSIARAIRRTNGQAYDVSSACEGVVMASRGREARNGQANKQEKRRSLIESPGGSALDWFYHTLHVRYAYQLKLRDTGAYGFLLPREHILPTGREVVNAVMEMGRFLLGEGSGMGIGMGEDGEEPSEQGVLMGAKAERTQHDGSNPARRWRQGAREWERQRVWDWEDSVQED